MNSKHRYNNSLANNQAVRAFQIQTINVLVNEMTIFFKIILIIMHKHLCDCKYQMWFLCFYQIKEKMCISEYCIIFLAMCVCRVAVLNTKFTT